MRSLPALVVALLVLAPVRAQDVPSQADAPSEAFGLALGMSLPWALPLEADALLLLLPPSRADAGPGGAELSSGRYTHWLVHDPLNLFSDVDPTAATLGLAVAGGVALASLADATLSEEAGERYTGIAVPILDSVNRLGTPFAFAGAAVIWGGTLLTGDEHLQSAAFTSVEAGLYASVLSFALKRAVGRVRPDAGEDAGPYEFHPFSGNASFPSGHATLAFALVTPWVVYYDHPLTYGLFVLATGTAIARVALTRHWPSDVLAGAVLGTAVGYSLARRHINDATDVSLDPGTLGSTPVLNLTFRF